MHPLYLLPLDSHKVREIAASVPDVAAKITHSHGLPATSRNGTGDKQQTSSFPILIK